MGPRYKVTGCFRFFLFLLFFVPAVFFGAAYIRGENGVEILKDFYHTLIGKESAAGTSKENPDETMRIETLRQKLDEAQAEIRSLKRQLQEKEEEIENLKATEKSNQ